MTFRLFALCVLVGGALAGASATYPVGDSDLYWHLATGQETLQHGFVRADVHSWTAPGAPVPTDQWLGDLLLYVGYRVGSWLGVLAVRTTGVAVLVGAIAAAALVRRPASPVAALATAVPAIVLSRYVWTERPELFGVACFAVLVVLLQLPGERPLLLAAPLLILWANLHGSFALGAALVLLIAALGVIRERALRPGHAVAAAGALLAVVLTPAGLGTLTTPGVHLLSPPRMIQEWSPPDPATAPGAIWALLFLLTLATATLSGRARTRDLVVIVPVALLSLVAIRHSVLFAIAATPYLAAELPSLVAAWVKGRGAGRWTARPNVAAPIVSATAGIVLIVMGILVAPREPEESTFPVEALAALPSGPGLFAQYDWGGWLIWRAPDTPVFVDGRLGLYRGAVLTDYRTVLEAAPGWREVLDRRGIRWLLVRPGDPVGVRAVELGWPVLSRSRLYVLISVVHRSP